MNSNTEKKKWFRIVGINLGVLLALLLLMEMVLQVVHYRELRRTRDFEVSSRNIEFEYNLFLQTRLKPNGGDVNRFGFRSPEIERVKNPGVVRIVMMGGSTTSDYRNVHQNTYPAMLTGLLRKRFPSRKIEYINAGSDWYSSEHSIINYLFWVKDFDPDIVIFMHTINDLVRSFAADDYSDRTGYKEDYSHYYGHVTNFIRLNRELLRHRFFSEFLLWKKVKEIFVTKPDVPKIIDVREFASLPAYKRNLQSIISILQADGIGLMFISEANLYRPDEKYQELMWMNDLCKSKGELPSYASMRRGMEMFNDALYHVAVKNNVPVVRGDTLIPKEPLYFRDDVHLTPKGNEMLARAILAVIEKDKKLSGYFTSR